MTSVKSERRLKQLRGFGFVMTAAFALASLAAWRRGWRLPWPVPLAVSAAFLAAALAAPRALEPLERPWMALARLLGAVNAFIILTAVYYVVLTPLAVLQRLFGEPPLDLTPRDTYWKDVDTGRDLSRYEKQF